MTRVPEPRRAGVLATIAGIDAGLRDAQRVQEAMSSFVAQQDEIRASLDRLVRAAVAPVDAVALSLIQQGVDAADLMTGIRESVRSFGTGLQFEFEGFRRIFQRYDELERRANPVLREAGWPVLPSWSMRFVVEVLKVAVSDGGGEAAGKLIVARYHADGGRRLVQAIKAPRLREVVARRSLLAQAVRAHRAKLWALTVPFLVAQIEGVIKDFAEAELPRIGKRVTKRSGKPRSRSVAHVLRGLPGRDDFFDQMADTLGELFTGGVLDRSAILHGRDLSYATEEHSLRCFLILIALDQHLAGVRTALDSEPGAAA